MDHYSDGELRAQALNMWANHIETGNVILSARDAAERNEPFNALNETQMETVLHLRRLARKETS